MKAFKVKFLNGHFVDQETDKRILPVQDKNYTIIADDDAFKETDDKMTIGKILNEKLKSMQIAKNYKNANTHILLKSNTTLLFRLGNSKVLKEDSAQKYYITCTLLEDLYIYSQKKQPEDLSEPTSWRMCKCKCQLKECIIGGLVLTEKILADSLNELFSNTVMFYYALQRSGSTNVFKNFYLYDDSKIINTHYHDLSRDFKSLDHLRSESVKKK